jgi:hypothetical protein
MGANVFLFPLYLFCFRILTLDKALKKIERNDGAIVFIRNAGLMDRIWWTTRLPLHNTMTWRQFLQFRVHSTMVISFDSKLQSLNNTRNIIVVELLNFRSGMVDPVWLPEDSSLNNDSKK